MRVASVLLLVVLAACLDVPERGGSPSTSTSATTGSSDFPSAYILQGEEIPQNLTLSTDGARLSAYHVTENPGRADIAERSRHRFPFAPEEIWLEILEAASRPKAFAFVEAARWTTESRAESAVSSAYSDRSDGCRPYHDPQETPHKIYSNRAVYVFVGYEYDGGSDGQARPQADEAIHALLAQNPDLTLWCDWP